MLSYKDAPERSCFHSAEPIARTIKNGLVQILDTKADWLLTTTYGTLNLTEGYNWLTRIVVRSCEAESFGTEVTESTSNRNWWRRRVVIRRQTTDRLNFMVTS